MQETSIAIQTTIAEARGVTRDFRVGSVITHALRGIDLTVQPANS